ncbi:MAG: rubredoxin [Methanomicrobiales archaeon]|nr:rubredoxin [Methanomicrobiales archaeon]
MELFACTKYGYVYNPRSGDLSQGVPPSTPFDRIPAGWHCPRCHVNRSKFLPIEGYR